MVGRLGWDCGRRILLLQLRRTEGGVETAGSFLLLISIIRDRRQIDSVGVDRKLNLTIQYIPIV